MRPIDADELRGIFEYSREHYNKQGDHGIAAGFSYAIGSLDESPTIPNATAELQRIAYDLLEMYKEAQESVIYEYSGNITEDEADLAKLIQEYKDRIDKLCP